MNSRGPHSEVEGCESGFGWERRAHAAVSRRPPNSANTIVARTERSTYAVRVWDLSLVQGLFCGPKPDSSDSRLPHCCMVLARRWNRRAGGVRPQAVRALDPLLLEKVEVIAEETLDEQADPDDNAALKAAGSWKKKQAPEGVSQ
jgi:hypothetical protein